MAGCVFRRERRAGAAFFGPILSSVSTKAFRRSSCLSAATARRAFWRESSGAWRERESGGACGSEEEREGRSERSEERARGAGRG